MELNRREICRILGVVACGGLAGCSNIGPPELSDSNSGAPTSKATNQTSRTEWDNPTQTAKLVPKNGDRNEEFGESIEVAHNGTVALIGAYGANESTGAAHVFSMEDESWIQQVKFTSSDGNPDDEFGKSVALSRDATTALVGATGEEKPNGPLSGAVYTFSRQDSSWTQESKVTPKDGVENQEFGESVELAADGTVAVIGTFNSGSAYIFKRENGSWNQDTKLIPEDGAGAGHFGESVALSEDGSTALVGARGDDNSNGTRAGAVYVFTRSDGSWENQAKLIAEDGDKYDYLGKSVEISDDGELALAGAPKKDSAGASLSGAAYIFRNSDGGWNQQAELSASQADENDYFGWSTSLSASAKTAVVGAVGDEKSDGDKSGSAYIFSELDGSWVEQVKLSPTNGDEDNSFGWTSAVAKEGQTAFLSAIDGTTSEAEKSGAVYAFSGQE